MRIWSFTKIRQANGLDPTWSLASNNFKSRTSSKRGYALSVVGFERCDFLSPTKNRPINFEQYCRQFDSVNEILHAISLELGYTDALSIRAWSCVVKLVSSFSELFEWSDLKFRWGSKSAPSSKKTTERWQKDIEKRDIHHWLTFVLLTNYCENIQKTTSNLTQANSFIVHKRFFFFSSR